MDNEEAIEARELRYLATPAENESLLMGGIAGLAAALAGAAAWATITIVTRYQIGFMAIGIGYLVGIVMRKTGNGYTSAFSTLAAVLAVLGCLIGNLLSACSFAAEQHEVSLVALLVQLTPSAAAELLKNGFSPIDGLFYFLAVSAAYRTSREQD